MRANGTSRFSERTIPYFFCHTNFFRAKPDTTIGENVFNETYALFEIFAE